MPHTLSFVSRAALVAVVGALSLPAAVFADQHEAGQQPDPVVGGLMLSDPQAFKTAITTGYRASQLLGAGVFNGEGVQVGSINDIVVGSDLRVSLAVISVGGFLGLGSRLVAIPTHRFERNANGDIMLPGATRQALQELPEFKYLQ